MNGILVEWNFVCLTWVHQGFVHIVKWKDSNKPLYQTELVWKIPLLVRINPLVTLGGCTCKLVCCMCNHLWPKYYKEILFFFLLLKHYFLRRNIKLKTNLINYLSAIGTCFNQIAHNQVKSEFMWILCEIISSGYKSYLIWWNILIKIIIHYIFDIRHVFR